MSGIHLALLGGTYATELKIGDPYEGGFYAGQISTSANGIATHNLVVAPVSSGEAAKKYRNATPTLVNSTSVIDGPTNTSLMANQSANYEAATFCADLTIGGYDDWYMPARDELKVLYYNLKPTTESNLTTFGTNSYSVPTRTSNYTAGDPAQTTAADFKDTGNEDFSASRYWSSTRINSSNASLLRFSDGQEKEDSMGTAYSVRAVRRIPL